MVKLSLDIKKKDFVWISLLIVLIGVGFVYAYNDNFQGGQPAVMGHSADEIMVNDSSGNSVSLQSLINEGGFGGGSLVCEIKNCSYTGGSSCTVICPSGYIATVGE